MEKSQIKNEIMDETWNEEIFVSDLDITKYDQATCNEEISIKDESEDHRESIKEHCTSPDHELCEDNEGIESINVTREVGNHCACTVCNLMVKEFASLNDEEKKKIILKGRPTPALRKLTKQNKLFLRHFQTENYKKCEWLTGCDNKSLLFCWPCILFSREWNLWSQSGFSDLNNLHKLIKRHAATKAHIRAIIQEKTFSKVITERAVDDQLKISNERHNLQVRKNREILKRFIDVVCFLGERELGFRGHTEYDTSSNKGNYVDLINLLAKYDETLKLHLENSTVFKGTSNIIQNDLISCIAELGLSKIKCEIQDALFISVILDEITDTRSISRLSKVVRYVTRKGEVKERFLGFLDVTTQKTASDLYNTVQTLINELNCGSKVVAQSYDRAGVTPDELERLQAKVRETYPGAIFVHCMTQRLDLALQQSASSNKESKLFFSTINGLAAFFSKSSKRTRAFDLVVQNRFPKSAPTTWNHSGRLVQSTLRHRLSLIDFFEQISENETDWDHETIVCSRGYLDMIKTDINFNLLLIIFSEVFPVCDKLFYVLQNKSSDTKFCIKKAQEFEAIISCKRDNFEVLWNKFKQLDIETRARTKRMRIDIAGDEKTWYRKLFLEILDSVTKQMDILLKNVTKLKFMELTSFKDLREIPEGAVESLKQSYSQYFDVPALRSELSVVYNTSEGINKSGVSDLLKSIKKYDLDQACGEIVKLCELTLTIPATGSATTEHNSALKRIKNFVRNSIGQERVSNLAFLSIEKELIDEISREPTFYDDVIAEFAKRSRRIPLNFK